MLRLGYCLPFLGTPHVPLFPSQCLIPAPSPPRGCSGEYLLGLGCQGCSGACSTPFSRLLQPSVSSVVDLGVMVFGHHPLPSHSLCGRVTLSVGVHSVCAPVSKSGDWLASFDLREAYLSVPVHPASRHFLRFLLRDTVYQFQALCFGLSRSSPRSWLLFQLYSILWVSVCVETSTPGWSSLPLRSLSSRFFRLSYDFVMIWGLSSIPGSPTSYLPR